MSLSRTAASFITKTSESPHVFNFSGLLRRKKTITEILVFCLLLFAATLIAIDKRYSIAVTDGIELWAATILPAMLPYIFITYVMSALSVTDKIAKIFSPLSEKVFNVNGNAFYAFFLSLMCGYPIGAKSVSELTIAKKLGKAESVRASALCASSSPAFIIGCIGNIAFNDPLFGVHLYISHFITVIAVGIIFSFYKRKEKPIKCEFQTRKNTPDILFDGVYSSVTSVLTIGGIITIFYLFTEMLNGLGVIGFISAPFSAAANNSVLGNALANGIFECTKGIKIAASAGKTFLSLPVCGALTGFGGISVMAQCCAFLKKAKIKTAPFILSRVIAAVLGFIFGLIVSVLFL